MENEQLSEKELKFGYWFVTNKIKLKNILLIVLFFSNLLLWGYIVYILVSSFGTNYWKDSQIRQDLVVDRFTNLDSLIESTKPVDIKVVSIDTYPSYDSRMDLVAKVTNPNANWLGTFKYQFVTSVNDTTQRNGFVMPGESKYLLDLDITSGSVGLVNIFEVNWVRVSDYAQIKEVSEQFEITNIKYLPKNTQENESSNNIASFTIKNNSNFNFHKPNFQVLLKNGTSVVAVNNVTVEELLSGQSRDISVGWVENILSVKSVEVLADINYISKDSYISF